MKIPNLGKHVLNSFEDIKKKEFFLKQEVLKGKSFCDICIAEPNLIKESLIRKDHQIMRPVGSIIDLLCVGDRNRISIMNETREISDLLILGLDMNFTGTIRRAME